MIKNALKNFFKNLIYVFVPMGIVYLFFLIAVFIFIGSLVQIAGAMLSDVFSLIETSVSESSASVNDFFAYAFDQLEWNGSFIYMIVRAFQTRWLSNTVKGFLETLNVSSAGFGESFDAIIGDFMVKFGAIISAVVILCVIGIVLANFLTRVIVRKNTAKRGIRKFVVAHTILPIVQALFVVGAVVVLILIRYYGLLVVAALLIMSCVFSLTSSWVVHRSGDLKLKDVVTMRNVLTHLASVGVILLLNVGLAAAFYAINPLLAILIMIPVILYSLNIVGVNTDSFVCEMIDKRRAADGAASGEAELTAGELAPAEGVGVAEGAEGTKAAEIAPAEEPKKAAEKEAKKQPKKEPKKAAEKEAKKQPKKETAGSSRRKKDE